MVHAGQQSSPQLSLELSRARRQPANDDVADVLDETGELLETQDASRWRVRAYRHAAAIVRGLPLPIAELLRVDGRDGLEALPGIGRGLAAAIDEIVHTGDLQLRRRLEGRVSPEDLFTTVPGIGEQLAHRIHDELEIETLENLEAAAHDGRLEQVDGFGERRARMVREYLAATLGRSSRRRSRRRRADRRSDPHAPPASTLLAIDTEYRRLAASGELRRIAPRRFNPHRHAWLPVWHTERDGWNLTVLFSNTGLAHDLGKTHDWVVIYFERDGDEDQCTVVTEHQGGLAGERVIRGREAECAALPDRGPRAEVRHWAHREAARR